MPESEPYDDTSVNGAVSPSSHDDEETDWAGDCDAGFPEDAEDGEDGDE